MLLLTIYSDIPSRDVAGFNVRSGSDVWRDDCKYQPTLSGMITKYSSGANLYLCFEYVLIIYCRPFPHDWLLWWGVRWIRAS